MHNIDARRQLVVPRSPPSLAVSSVATSLRLCREALSVHARSAVRQEGRWAPSTARFWPRWALVRRAALRHASAAARRVTSYVVCIGVLFGELTSAHSTLIAAGQPPMVTDFMFVGDSLTFYNGGVWEEVARLAPEGALGHIETVVQGYAPLAKLLPMARATLQQLGPKEEGRRRVCVLQVRFMGLTLTPCVGFWRPA